MNILASSVASTSIVMWLLILSSLFVPTVLPYQEPFYLSGQLPVMW